MAGTHGSRSMGLALLAALAAACAGGGESAGERPGEPPRAVAATPVRLDGTRTHNKFSGAIAPIARVESGAIVEARTREASDGQLTPDSPVAAILALDFDRIHPLTGPIHVEGAEPGDVLAVKLLEIEVGEWGWSAVAPGFGFLADEFAEPYLKTFRLGRGATEARFSESITIPLHPFPGVLGVAPPTGEMLSTIPPRANGGNMDNKYLTVGTTVYFPVFVDGALFSIGDPHVAQGAGEVCGTAIEAPLDITFSLELLKGGRAILEPEYETDEFYAVTAFATTIDEAARRATRYMIDYLIEVHGLERDDAYVLCSLAGDLEVAEVVDAPHVLVAMHMPKSVLPRR